MDSFSLYIHGCPVGHDIWGPEENRDYIKQFYNHDEQELVSSAFHVERIGNSTYYTYLRKKNVSNADGRPGSYFGMTLCFVNKYCKNVYTLFQIFEAVYSQICVGRLIEQNNNYERFLIRDFANDATDILNNIKTLFGSNIKELSFVTNDNMPRQSGAVRYNLKDVDSPIFFETSRHKKILISPDYPSKDAENDLMIKQVAPLQNKCHQLQQEASELKGKLNSAEQANITLQNNVSRLENEKLELKKQLESAEKNIRQHYEDEIRKAEQKIKETEEKIRKQKESSDQTIKESVNLIKEPLEKLARLVASRFPDNNYKVVREDETIREKVVTSNGFKVWIPTIINILLCVLLGLVLYNTYKEKGINDGENTKYQNQITQLETRILQLESEDQTLKEKNSDVSEQETTEDLKVRIDVSGNGFKGENLILGKTYTITAKCKHDKKHAKDECISGKNLKFKVEGATLDENQITVTDSNKVCIICFLDSKEIQKREINVKTK